MSDLSGARVAILGSGWAAAFAYRACCDNGIRPKVYTREYPAYIGPTVQFPGAFWIHWLPEKVLRVLTANGVGMIEISHLGGSWASYSTKLYGKPYNCSFPTSDGKVELGYDARMVWPLLWEPRPNTEKREFTCQRDIAELATNYDLVIQTFPKPGFKPGKADFSMPVRAAMLVISCKARPQLGGNKVMYNGIPDEGFSRYSNLFGIESWEIPLRMAGDPRLEEKLLPNLGPDITTKLVWKIHPNVEPESERFLKPNIHLIGRYATWDRSQLAHQAYQQTLDLLAQRS